MCRCMSCLNLFQPRKICVYLWNDQTGHLLLPHPSLLPLSLSLSPSFSPLSPDLPKPQDTSSMRHTLHAVLEEESPLDPNTRSLSPAPSSSSPSFQRKHTRERGGKHVLTPYRMSQVIKLEYDLSHPIYDEVKRIILQQMLSWLQPEREPPTNLKSPLPPPSPTVTSPRPSPSFPLLPSGEELMQEMWFTSRDNVNLLCEICRQSFLMKPSEAVLIKRVIELYWGWMGSGEPPPFMLQPPVIFREEGEGVAESHLSVPHDEGKAGSWRGGLSHCLASVCVFLSVCFCLCFYKDLGRA